MIIAISGKAGSGKSTAAQNVAKKLKYKYYSIGDLQRKFADEKGITLEELRRLEEKDKSIDKQFDDYQKRLGEKENDFVIESRLGPFFLKNAFKIFLDCDDDVRVKRILSDVKLRDNRKVEFSGKDPAKQIFKRDLDDQKRYLKYYGFDFLDMRNYDFVLDSSYLTQDEVVDIILDKVKKMKKK